MEHSLEISREDENDNEMVNSTSQFSPLAESAYSSAIESVDVDSTFEQQAGEVSVLDLEPHVCGDHAKVNSNRQSSRDGNYSDIDGSKLKSTSKVKSNVNIMTPNSKMRSRPRRSSEPPPFLCIDTVAKENKPRFDETESSKQKKNKLTSKSGSSPQVPYNTPTASYHISRSQCSSRASSNWNQLVPRMEHSADKARDGNTHLRSPFKHAVSKSSNKGDRPLSPGQEMREKTAAATYLVAKSLAKQNVDPEPRLIGRILKGKLKPLCPVVPDGPKMTQCRGIIAQNRTYSASPSRTLQRRRQLLNTLNQQYMFNGTPNTESIHRTSIASDDSDTGEQQPDEDPPVSVENTPRGDESGSQIRVGISGPPNSLSSIMEQSSGYLGDNVRQTNFGNATKSYSGTNETKQERNVGMEMHSDNMKLEPVPALSTRQNDQKRNRMEMEPPLVRPKSVGDPSGRKAVRFADQGIHDRPPKCSSATIHRTSTQPGSSVKANPRSKGRSTCKSEIREPKYKTDEDDDDANYRDGSGGGGHHGDRRLCSSAPASAMHSSVGNPSSQNNSTNHQNSGNQRTGTTLCSAAFGFDNFVTDDQRSSSRQQLTSSSVGLWKDAGKPDSDLSEFTLEGCGQKPVQRSDDKLPLRPELAPGAVINGMAQSRKCNRPQSAGAVELSKKRYVKLPLRPQSAKLHGVSINVAMVTKPPMHKVNVKKVLNPHVSSALQKREQKPIKKRAELRHESMVRKGSSGDKRLSKDHNRNCIDCCHFEQNLKRCNDEDSAVNCQRCKSYVAKREISENSEKLDDQVERDTCKTRVHHSRVKFKEELNETEQTGRVSEASVQPMNSKKMTWDNLEDLENSLDAVQQEIQQCITECHNCDSVSEGDDYDDNDIDSQSNSPTTNSVEQIHYMGEISKTLTGTEGKTSDVEVYYCEAIKSRDDVNDLTNTTKRTFVDSGQVSSYNTTGDSKLDNMNLTQESEPSQQVHPKLTGGEDFLKLLCDNLPSVTEEKKTPVKMKEKPLEIKATVKVLSKQLHHPPAAEPIAPYPPLCFKVNARPPPGYMYYFAYGLDMNSNRLSVYLQRKVEERLWGLLFGFKLLFNKVGEELQAGCFPNIAFSPQSSVEGCLYLITQKELQLLDGHIGYPQHEHVMLPVWLLNCSEPDDLGIAQYCVPALMYITRDKWITQDVAEQVPNEFAHEQILRASDMLTPNYTSYLDQLRPGVEAICA